MIIDVLRYLVICAVLVSCGLGTLGLCRASIPAPAALLLAPAVTQALWACLLGLAVITGHPVRSASLLVWPVTLALAAYGAWTPIISWWRASPQNFAASDRTAWWLIGGSAGAAILVLLPFFTFGLSDYLGSGRLDGWGYVAYGQYLWTFPRGTEGGLAPLYQWASHLSWTRHVGSAQLGLLSILSTPGDTQASIGLFLSGVMFTYASSCAALAYTLPLPRHLMWLYVMLAVVCGWSLNVIWADNFDNALALLYLPALAAMLALRDRLAVGAWALLGLMAAGMLYTYPEFAPLTTPALGLLVVQRLVRVRASRELRGALVALAVCIICLSPYLLELVSFIRGQMSMGLQTGAPRPGNGYFPGLLVPRYQLSAIWALGGEFNWDAGLHFRNVASIGLFILLILGLVRWLAQRTAALVAVCGLFLLAAAVMITRQAYDYGAYKMILLGWWVIALAIVSGVAWLSSTSRTGRVAAGISIAICLVVPALAVARSVESVATRRGVFIEPYRGAAAAARLGGTRPIAVFVNDLLASHWAVYFLRDTPIRLHASPGGYLTMPHVQPLLARAHVVQWEETHLLLRDAVERDAFDEDEGWSLVRGVGAYSLWDTRASGWAVVAEQRNPNGFETVRGHPFFWMGGERTELTLVAQRAGHVELSAEFGPGPSVAADIPSRRLLIEAGAQRATLELVGSGRRAVSLPLRAGENRVTLSALDRPTITPTPGGDPRPLVLGVYQPRIRFAPAAPASTSHQP